MAITNVLVQIFYVVELRTYFDVGVRIVLCSEKEVVRRDPTAVHINSTIIMQHGSARHYPWETSRRIGEACCVHGAR